MSLSHVIRKAEGPARKVVVVGGGPAGLEAARVSAERGHHIELYEAAADVGGQILVGATGSWRRDLMGIVEWRVAELERLGVAIHTNSYMEGPDIEALDPDVVILATGGLPQIDLAEGADLCISTWDVLTGQVPIAGDVLVYDGTGRHPAPLAAERAREAGAEVSYVAIDATIAEELTYAERLRWKKRFLKLGVQPLGEHRLLAVSRNNNRLQATLVNEISLERVTVEADQVIVEQGSVPMDEVYKEARKRSCNDGVTDLRALVEVKSQPKAREHGFELHRIGDAVSSRNIHAAMLDALRVCSAL